MSVEVGSPASAFERLGGLPEPDAHTAPPISQRARRSISVLGPAFVASIAYVDPGNFATNIQGGSAFGYQLLWVVVVANLAAMLLQYLSAKVGIATDRTLPELCREHLRPVVCWALWLQAELVAMATDIAEFLGAAIALNLLFGVPMLIAGVVTGVIALLLLQLSSRGYRRFEVAITFLLAIILVGFAYEVSHIGPSARMSLRGLVPSLSGQGSLLLAAGIIGATVMPHAIYLHSALVKQRVACLNEKERQTVLRFTRLDVLIALGAAGLANMAMLAVAAKLFHDVDSPTTNTIEQAHTALAQIAGGAAALAFAVALLASGISSSSVGTYAGQVVMQGFVRLSIPVVLRRLLTMMPAMALLAAGVEPTKVLVVSQVALSFGIPAAVIPLIALTASRGVMGSLVNRRATSIGAACIAALVIALNLFLVVQQVHR